MNGRWEGVKRSTSAPCRVSRRHLLESIAFAAWLRPVRTLPTTDAAWRLRNGRRERTESGWRSRSRPIVSCITWCVSSWALWSTSPLAGARRRIFPVCSLQTTIWRPARLPRPRACIWKRCTILRTSTPRSLHHEVFPRHREPQGHQLGGAGRSDRWHHHQSVLAVQAGRRPRSPGRVEGDLLARRRAGLGRSRRRLDPPSPPCRGGGDDRGGCRDLAARRIEEAAHASAHRPRPRSIPRRLEPAGRAGESRGLTWVSPLSARYASPAMQALWGERRRIGLWRRLWLALMEVERDLGLAIPAAALTEVRAHLDDVDLDKAAEYERRLRHDVMAHIHHLGDQAPAARPFIHLGATSAYVTDNADLVLMREAMQLLLGRIGAVLVAMGKVARRYRALPCLAYTHFQPAQLTTVGKRTTLWMQDLALDAEELLNRIATLRFRGVKGTTGTQASFLELFDGDHAKVAELDSRVSRAMRFDHVLPITGQTYTRKLDGQVLAVLSGVAQSAAKFATDLRLLQHEAELLEPFESEQVGSSAMPYKRNPMRAERITSLARFVIELEGNAWHTAAAQWLERTLDDSANRRLVIPEAFLATDAILVLAINVAAGLEVREETITQHVAKAMPFLATERLLMRGVKAGGDRQQLHEVIRTHSLQGADQLLDHLARAPEFQRLKVRATPDELVPAAYVGRAPQQVDDFLDRGLPDLMRAIQAAAPAAAAAEVQV